jgi:hypothetical protein
MTPRVGTAANSMQANTRPKAGGLNIKKKEADNDDTSSVSSESSTDIPLIVNINCTTTRDISMVPIRLVSTMRRISILGKVANTPSLAMPALLISAYGLLTP